MENSFGILRNRFQVYGHPLRQKPHRAVKVVKATIALHNFLRTKNSSRGRYTPPESLDVEDVLTGKCKMGYLTLVLSRHSVLVLTLGIRMVMCNSNELLRPPLVFQVIDVFDLL